jgi:hypothetical protein
MLDDWRSYIERTFEREQIFEVSAVIKKLLIVRRMGKDFTSSAKPLWCATLSHTISRTFHAPAG